MSTRTANYGLHQWAGEDKFLRSDFNEDNAKADAAIKAAYDRAGTVEASLTNKLAAAQNALNAAIGKKADTTALNSLKTTVNGIQSQLPVKCEVGAAGSYTGDGEYPRTINVGFRPKLVFIELTWGTTYGGNGTYGGWFTAELPLLSGKDPCTQITDTGFVLDYSELNQKGRVYHYLCLK